MAHWAELLEAAVGEGLLLSWRVYRNDDGALFVHLVHDEARHYKEVVAHGPSSLPLRISDALSDLRRARRPAVEDMDADALEEELWRSGRGVAALTIPGTNIVRRSGEDLTPFLRRVVAHIRETEGK